MYILPSHANYRCLDRFDLNPDPSISEDENSHVPFWPILVTLLSQPVTSPAALIDILETISFTLTGSTAPATDHDLLRDALADVPEFFTRIWPRVVRTALEMPLLFHQVLPILGSQEDQLVLSRQQTACLVVHQFLRTLRAPSWRADGTHDFGIWYSCASQRQESAARAYLKALMVYFDEVVARLDDPELKKWNVIYTLRSLRGAHLPDDKLRCLMKVDIVVVDDYDTLPVSLGVPGGAAVVSANRNIGFGQSATQEEIHVGISPEACSAVLVTPPLKEDQVLVIHGAQAMVNVVGQRREISVERMKMPEGGVESWKERRILFMDALELDLVGEGRYLPDFIAGNVEREMRKAYTAFSSGGLGEVRTGLWGCGAFGGDPAVKFWILWYAASLAGVDLVLVCDKQSQVLAQSLKTLTSLFTPGNAIKIKDSLASAPRTLVRNQSIRWFLEDFKLLSKR